MTKRYLAIAVALFAGTAAVAAPGGKLRVLPRGVYECATPGLAGESAVVVQEDLGFEIVNGSSYLHNGTRGTYLHTGNSVVFTSGDMRGARFRRTSENALHALAKDGSLGNLRCVRLGF